MPYIENTPKDIRSPLARARNHGAAKTGTHHWWMQRVTAIALIPLTLWMLSCLECLITGHYTQFIEWLKSPFVAIALSLFIITSFYHAALGLQVIIEDYIHKKSAKITCLLFSQFTLFILGVICIFSILKINFGVDPFFHQ